MKSKFSVVPLSVALLAASASCLAGGDEGVTVSAASVQRKMPVKAKLSAVPSEYAARINTSGLVDGAQYDSFIVHYRTYTGLRNVANNTSVTHNARVAGARNVSIQEKGMTGTGGRVIKTAKAMSPSDAQAFMLEYAKSAEVESIEPNAIMQPNWDFNWYMNFLQTGMLPDMVTPNDQYFSQQWGLSNERGVPGILMASAWGFATGRGVVVAVVDTGITAHSDLAGQVLPGYNFVSNATFDRNRSGRSADASDPGDWLQMGDQCPANGGPYYVQDSTWHGTHVSGIVAAKANNGAGIAGVAYNSKILPVRAMARCGGATNDIADGIIWASGGSVPGVPANPNPAKVINLSLGGGGTCSSTFQQAINIARSNGATVVVSAGNDAQDASNQQPANCQGVIVVGATSQTGVRSRTGGMAWFSNYGSLITVMAPGASIYSTINSGRTVPAGEGYGWMSGTSQAAPHVAGVVALVLEQNPGLTTEQIKKYIVPTAVPMKGDICPKGCGAGLIDAWGAVFPAVLSGGATTIQPGQSVAHLSSNWGDGDAERWFDITLPAGTRAFKLTTEGGTGNALIAATKNAYYMWWTNSTDNDCEWQKFCQTTFDAPLTEPVTYYINVGTRSAYSNVTLVTHIE